MIWTSSSPPSGSPKGKRDDSPNHRTDLRAFAAPGGHPLPHVLGDRPGYVLRAIQFHAQRRRGRGVARTRVAGGDGSARGFAVLVPLEGTGKAVAGGPSLREAAVRAAGLVGAIFRGAAGPAQAFFEGRQGS